MSRYQAPGMARASTTRGRTVVNGSFVDAFFGELSLATIRPTPKPLRGHSVKLPRRASR